MQPTVFLFDADFEGVSSWYGGLFDPAFLVALQNADPKGEVATPVLRGDTMQSLLVRYVSSVHVEASGKLGRIGHTQSHNAQALLTLSHDIAASIDARESWFTGDPKRLSMCMVGRNTHCIGVLIEDQSLLEQASRELHRYPWFLGALQPDVTNPIHTQTFLENLICDAAIKDGAVHIERSWEGDVHTEFEGASGFQPNGLVVEKEGWLRGNGFRTPRYENQNHSTVMLQRFQQKMQPSAVENVVSSLVESVLDDGPGFSFRLDAVHDQTAVLEAILPNPKFTKYLFVHREKDDKSNWLINELGVQPDDWRFLAAQLYSGLLRQSRFDVEVVEYGEGEPKDYRGKFNQTLELVARDMKVMPATIVWQMKKGELPSLVTIKPGAKGKTPLGFHYPVEVFPPHSLSGHKHMEDLLRVADFEGSQSAEAAVPTPIVVEGEWYSNGMGGCSRIQVEDGMLAKYAKVIEVEADFRISTCGQLGFRHSSGSLEKAMQYAKTFCRVLSWNGFKASFDLCSD